MAGTVKLVGGLRPLQNDAMAWRAGLRLFLWAAALAAAPMPAAAADPLAEALALPVASELVGARDTARFAWVEKAAGVRNIWIADRGRPALRITSYAEDDGQELSDLELSADGSILAFVRGGDPEFPDDALPNAGSAVAAPRQQLFVAAPGAGTPMLVGEGHSPAFAPGGTRLAFTRHGEIWLWDRGGEARKLATVAGEVRRLQWSPDGARLLFIDHRGDYSFVALLEVAQRRLRYLDPGLGFSVEPVFSPDGRHVAFVHYVEPPAGAAPDAGPYWSLRIAEVGATSVRTLWTAPPGPGGHFEGTRSRNLYWSANGKLIFPWERSGWLHAYAIDAAGDARPAELTPGAFEVEAYLLGADGRSIVYAANAGDLDRRHIWRRPLDGTPPTRVTAGDGVETAPTLAGEALAVIATDVTHPAHPALVERKLLPLKPVPAAAGFVTPEPVKFLAADGIEIHGILFRARGPGRHPALVFVHGGPRRQMLPAFHSSSYYSNAYVMNQHLAARGFDVLAVNYRSGTGYGAAFRDAPEQARGGASEYRDVLAAGRWLAARDHVDPKRIGIWGGSWGGYLTALALARDSELFAAGVDFHGVHSMLRPLPGNLSPAAQESARQLQWDSSPLASIERWRSPVLLIHGDDDRNVDFSQSVLLARELAARRIPYRELVFPNERHSFLLHSHWLTSYRATRAFLEEMLEEPRP